MDVLVVSESFEGLTHLERVAHVRCRLPEDLPFDITALTPSELERLKDRAFYREVSRYWVEV